MRQSRFTEAQIIGMIKEQEAGLPTAEVCRRYGLSPASFYKFIAGFEGEPLSAIGPRTMVACGMNVSDTFGASTDRQWFACKP